DGAEVCRVDEVDLRAALADPALEERAHLSIDVFLRDDAAASRDRACVRERGDRRHAARETHRGRGALELREGDLERGRRRCAVAPIDVAGSLIPEDLVLPRRRAVIERHALHERRGYRLSLTLRQRTRRSHDARSLLKVLPHGGRVYLRPGRGLLAVFNTVAIDGLATVRRRLLALERLRALDEVGDLLAALATDPLEVAGTVLRSDGLATLLADTSEELRAVLARRRRAALLAELLVELRAVLFAHETTTHAARLGHGHTTR